jgi:hypothetical protein
MRRTYVRGVTRFVAAGAFVTAAAACGGDGPSTMTERVEALSDRQLDEHCGKFRLDGDLFEDLGLGSRYDPTGEEADEIFDALDEVC